ncbi:MAG: zinc ribbon domain-containing protein [Pseudomonadota bacterium]
MSQCPHCRQEIDPGQGQCPSCGAALPAGGQAPPPPPPPDPGQAYYQGGSGQAWAGDDLAITPQDWRDFLGPNAEAYLPKFARFAPGGLETFVATWHWPAFLATFWWFLYRKLYLWFGLCLVGMFIPHLRWLVWVAAGIVANYIYFIEAQKQIRAIKATSPAAELSARLAQAGGVHPWVPWVAVAVSLGGFLLLAVLVLFLGGLTLGWLMGLASYH